MKIDPVVHFEMAYLDPKRVMDFYTQVFSWKMQQLGQEMGHYVLAQSGVTDEKGVLAEPNRINGGFYKVDKVVEGTTHLVIAVDDLAVSMQKIKDHGGSVTGEPMDIPGVGNYVSFTDSEGNRVGLLQPAPMG